MPFQPFPDNLLIKTIDTGESVVCFESGTINQNIQIRNARVIVYVNGLTVTTEKMRINVFATSGDDTPLFSSDWSSLIDIPGVNDGNNWLGWLRFDFGDRFLDLDNGFSLELETSDYTRDGDITYLGLSLDYPLAINAQVEGIPVGVELYGIV